MIMSRALVLLFLSIFILTACDTDADTSSREVNDDSHKSENTSEKQEPFNFQREQVVRVTIYLGGTDEVVADIKESEKLDELSTILQGAPAFSGEAPADWNNTIVIQSRDGSERNLEVTGNGYVFI
ncbi:hypothetical protein FHS18_006123 [Paenibacillus phyllosphaerae]|uniref:GerMN domain-containing protein n=1 Tax=Paenibacillus phyllosphaerae TaxID=274593 RepID=A0A7W5B413_9BACL|nr:hypothetical protein [Paenibacillus phyllosphaerae]MBB3114007.1 hypothetical protein [Paenibacillus phyllosphaerae]